MDSSRICNLIKYEFSDENIKSMFIELRDKYFKLFKDYIKFIKVIKNKDEKNIGENLKQLNELNSEILVYKGLLEKIIGIRKNKSDFRDFSDLKIVLQTQNCDEFLKNLEIRKSKLLLYKDHYLLIKEYSRRTHEFLREASFSNCLDN